MCESIEEAMEYIKGYCSKHSKCVDGCRLFNNDTSQCFLYDDAVPCDWDVNKKMEGDYND